MSTRFPSKETVERLRIQYPAGTRIELVSMEDPYSTLIPGDRGSVSHVDDTGTIFVRWDNGSGLGLVYGEDSYRKIEEIKELASETPPTKKPSVLDKIREAREAPQQPGRDTLQKRKGKGDPEL